MNNGSAGYSLPYSVPNVSASMLGTSSASMIGKNQFRENGGNLSNSSITKMNASQPSNIASQQPSSTMGKKVAPNRLDPNMVSSNTMGIEPINIGVTPTDIKLLSDMSTTGIILTITKCNYNL